MRISVLLSLLGVTLIIALAVENNYRHNTPISIQLEHEKIAGELKTLHRGDFIEWKYGFCVVELNVHPDQRHISIRSNYTRTAVDQDITFLARSRPKITRSTDPNWTETAKRFLGAK